MLVIRQPEEGAAFTSLNANMKVYYHRVGTAQSADVLVYERPDQPDWGFQLSVSEDGRYLIITVWLGTDDRYRIVVKDLTEPYGLPTELISNFDHEYSLSETMVMSSTSRPTLTPRTSV
jgi:prolyl oligopeptidase